MKNLKCCVFKADMKKLLMMIGLAMCSAGVQAQQGDETVTKDANNPLATIKSFSVHNIYNPSLYAIDGTAITTWFRYSQPIGRVLIRASMPVNTVNVGDINRSGLGDMNMFGTYILTKPTAANQIGVGPLLSIPTATSTPLGSGKWQLGLAFVGYFAANPVFQSGVLATWQHSIAGKDDRRTVNAASVQPFLMWQLGKGVYLRSSAVSILDFEKGNYLVPVGLGAGKIVKIGKAVCNLFAEPQFAVWNKGEGLPKTQIFVGVNTQF